MYCVVIYANFIEKLKIEHLDLIVRFLVSKKSPQSDII